MTGRRSDQLNYRAKFSFHRQGRIGSTLRSGRRKTGVPRTPCALQCSPCGYRFYRPVRSPLRYLPLVMIGQAIIIDFHFRFPFSFIHVYSYRFCPCACTDRCFIKFSRARYGLRSRSASLEDWNAAYYTYRAFGERSACFLLPI